MALQRQTSNPLSDFAALLRRQLWSILLPFAFVTALGIMIAQLIPRTYDVTTIVKVPDSGIPGTGSPIQRDVSAAKNDMRAEPLIRSVIESQEWPDYVGLTEEEKRDFVTRVIKNTTVNIATIAKNSAGSSYITVFYRDSEGLRAERFLNALRDRYIDSVVKSVREEARRLRDTYKQLKEKTWAEYQAAEKAKSELVKLKNLATTIAAPNGGTTRSQDPVYASLVLSQDQLAVAKLTVKEKQAKLELTERLLIAEPSEIPASEVPQAPGADKRVLPVDDISVQIKDLEQQILDKREKQKDYRPLATAYQKLEDEIHRAEEKIASLKNYSGPNAILEAKTSYVPNPKRAVLEQQKRDLETDLAVLKVSISTLEASIADLARDHQQRQDAYYQLAILESDVNRAAQSYTAAVGAFDMQVTRVALLEGPMANPFELVQAAKASDTPIFPNVPIFVLVSVFLGIAAGLGVAITSEFLRNGFNGLGDLSRGLAVPVLGAVNTIRTRAELRRAWTRHVMIGASTLVIVGAILWVTWAYQNDSLRWLGPQLTQIIDDVRLAFRP